MSYCCIFTSSAGVWLITWIPSASNILDGSELFRNHPENFWNVWWMSMCSGLIRCFWFIQHVNCSHTWTYMCSRNEWTQFYTNTCQERYHTLRRPVRSWKQNDLRSWRNHAAGTTLHFRRFFNQGPEFVLSENFKFKCFHSTFSSQAPLTLCEKIGEITIDCFSDRKSKLRLDVLVHHQLQAFSGCVLLAERAWHLRNQQGQHQGWCDVGRMDESACQQKQKGVWCMLAAKLLIME